MRPDLLHIEYRYLCCCTLSLALLLLLPGRGIAEQIFGSSFISTIHPACLYAAMAVAGICALFMTALWLAVTKYKRSLRKLDDKEKLLKTIADYTYDWELWIGNNGSILFCSPACERISGYARTAFEKHPHLLEKIVHPEDAPRYRCSLRTEAQQFHAFRIIDRKGNIRWVEHLCREIYDDRGNSLGRRSTIRDITDRKTAENRFLLAHYAIDSSKNPLAMISMEGIITYANPAMMNLFGFTSSREILGKQVVSLLAPQHEEMDIVQTVKTEGHYREEMLARNKQGALFELELHAFITRDVSGTPLSLTAFFTDITTKKADERKIKQLAFSDALTGLPNRLALKKNLDRTLAMASQSSGTVAVLMLDLDDFKQINDTTGHARGDELLLLLTSRLKKQLGEADSLARLGGDEFVLVFAQVDNTNRAARKTHQILSCLSDKPFDLGESQVFTSASIGIALFPQNGKDSETLLRHADMAMYEAKKSGRNTYRFFSDELHRRTIERHQLEAGLRRALRNEEFFLVYQPQVDLRTGQIIALEALVRWQHPEAGTLLPSMFIPIAEKTGLIHTLGEWILRTACHQAMQWRRAGLPPFRMAVNLSAQQFKQADLVERIEQVLLSSGLEARYLELEITESVFMENLESAIEILVDLKARAIQIAIDDFGTGYSSLNYLKNFPIDRIKIAQEFVRDIPDDHNDAVIIETILVMAERLGLKVLAEGVEVKEQMKFLRDRNCFEMQGFYFSPPLQAQQMEDLLKQPLAQEYAVGLCP